MCRLCTYRDAPEWSVHNQYIHTGYRTNFTFKDAFKSVLMVHNETANIWTHILGLLIFVIITATMASGWGRTHLAALPGTWTVGTNHTKAALVAKTVQFRHTVKLSGKALVGVARSVKNNEALHAAAQTMVQVAHAIEERLHGNVDVGALRPALMKRLKEARALVQHAASSDLSSEAISLGKSFAHQLETHAGALHQMLEESIVGASDEGWHLDNLELPGPHAPRWPMYVFLAGAIVCLSFSAVCHTLACVGARVSTIVWRIDYVGIAVLIVASFFPVVYYSFYCVPLVRHLYLTVMSIFGLMTLIVTLAEQFQDARYSPFRALLFSSLGGCGAVPILHQTWFTWHNKPTPIQVMLWMELLMGACYLSGAYIYAMAVPEKWKPGRFDIWASSHNIFHVLVVMGAYVHYRAALVLLAWRDHHGCEADVTMLHGWYVDGGSLGKWLPNYFAGGHYGGEL